MQGGTGGDEEIVRLNARIKVFAKLPKVRLAESFRQSFELLF